ncbi:MAG: hypothetical protein KKC05_03415 [Nanoarchaeota archaeon]|nr:hypothetical protein [Nanoarchaeota archaeon]
MSDKISLTIYFVVAIVMISLIVNLSYAAETSEQTTPSNATVSKNVAIALSTNLSTGIQFGSVNPASGNNNATGNNDGGEGEAGDGGPANSSYFIAISTDSNINVDICIRDDWELNTSDDVVIRNGNYSWTDNSTSNSTEDNTTEFYMLTKYVKTNVTNMAGGARTFFKFWLDVPAAQAAGTYNNTVYFKGVENAVACGS